MAARTIARLCSSIVCSLLALAWADDTFAQAAPAYKFEKKEDVKAVEWKATAQGGIIVTTGNANTTSLSAGANATRKAGGNKLQLDFTAAYVRSQFLLANDLDGNGTIDSEAEIDRQTRTTNRSWLLSLRYDRFFTENNSAYVLGRAAADEPAGKELLGGAQVGYSRRLLKTDRHDLAVELGYDFTYEAYVGGAEANDIHSARAFAGYVAKVAGETGLEASVEALFNLNEETSPAGGTIGAFEDTRVIGKAAVSTKLFEDISFRVAFTPSYDQAPAPLAPFAIPYAAGFTPLADELDTKTEAVVVVNFL